MTHVDESEFRTVHSFWVESSDMFFDSYSFGSSVAPAGLPKVDDSGFAAVETARMIERTGPSSPMQRGQLAKNRDDDAAEALLEAAADMIQSLDDDCEPDEIHRN